MWRNYLTVGLRALAKNKVYAFINIFGLALGLAAFVLILLFLRYETGYDRSLAGAESTYQFQTYLRDAETGRNTDLQMAAFAAEAPLRKDFPEIERMVYALSAETTVVQKGEASPGHDVIFVDGPLFDVLRFPFAAGDAATALAAPGSIVITESEALKRFGGENPLGKTLTLTAFGKSADYRVTGVLKDLPRASHFRASMAARFDPVSYFSHIPPFLTSWGWQTGWIYASMKPRTDIAALNARLHAWEMRNRPDAAEISASERARQRFAWVNVREVHLGKAQEGAMTAGNDWRTLVTFALVALLILVAACINFTNLSTARATQRAREVALRKLMGATRGMLIRQFLWEALLLVTIAMIVALALIELSLPWYSRFVDADLRLPYLGDGGLIGPLTGLVVAVALLGGLYPAFFLSRFRPSRVLKANKSAVEADGSGRLRNLLVVTQFAVSVTLIVCTIVIYTQTVFARSIDPGFDRSGLIQIQSVNDPSARAGLATFVAEAARIDGVAAVGRTTVGVATKETSTGTVAVPGLAAPVSTGQYLVDPGFFSTIRARFLAGRDFVAGREIDDSTLPWPSNPDAEAGLAGRGINVVVNAAAAKQFGFASPDAAIGRQVRILEGPGAPQPLAATIIGVIADARFRSVRDAIEPMLFQNQQVARGQILLRYSGTDPAAVRARVHRLWKRLFPGAAFKAEFSDDIIAALYGREDRQAQAFGALAFLSVAIGCLGLFGLAAFVADQRTKEIGIRKVLGARVHDIVRLLVWQFSRPVLVANLIAWPIAWWAMRDWLNQFDLRIPLGPTPFLVAGLLALALAIGTIASHAFRVARANPIHALRYE